MEGRQEGRQEANPKAEVPVENEKPNTLPTWTWEIDVRQGSVRSVAHTTGAAGGIDAMFLPAYAKLLVKVALQVGNAGDVARWLPMRPYEEVVGVEDWVGEGDGKGVGEGDGVGEQIREQVKEQIGEVDGEGDRCGEMEMEMERGVEVELEVGR